MGNKIEKIFRGFLYILPAVLYFSYFPIIRLGTNETMNFELSLPLIWLVLFDLFSLVVLIREKLIGDFFKKWVWLLFPVFVTLSIIWSDNVVRGILTTGILWLIYFALFAFWQFKKEILNDDHKKIFWRWFFVSSLLVCVWCWLQCVLDVIGVSRDCTLLCAGCTYKMFGFPHPNGFAIEPQFMGNLLLAPTIISGWMMTGPGNIFHLRPRPSGPSPRADGANSRLARLRNAATLKYNCHLSLAVLFFIFMATLFLTFSRGAIYAFVVAIIFMSVFVVVRERKKRGEILKRVGLLWGLVVLSFAFTLNMQGVFAQLSQTDDTYESGVAKVLNQLSLGIIDIRTDKKEFNKNDELDKKDANESVEEIEEVAMFDGYVVESTDTRVRLTKSALTIWRKDFKNLAIGVGIGGAGQALYDNDLSPAPKEIVQNEYASLLLETGMIGFLLFILTIVLVFRVVVKNPNAGMILTLIIAYGITLCFFSGLPNALQIYLLPAILSIYSDKTGLRKKLVS